jgi:hypothetical protein
MLWCRNPVSAATCSNVRGQITGLEAWGSRTRPSTTDLRDTLQMSVLLARSENQILVLETLLKRLVQVCVHTQDKRLAKELKLMDFTRLVR